MKARNRIILLIAVMVTVILAIDVISVAVLYHTALAEEEGRLREVAQSQARLIEAIARFDQVYTGSYPHGARQATLTQIIDAHEHYAGFGDTGEFTLAERDGDQIRFLLSHRHHDLDDLQPVHWEATLAEPMRRALSGHSGTLIGVDYRGVEVLAAHEPVAVLDLGIVAKIDLAEIRDPFVRAGLLVGLASLVLIIVSAGLFHAITNPILRRLRETVTGLEQALGEVKTLRGILPICSYCKNIRDDEGYWNQLEVYVAERSDADFSHGICPDCMKQHHPEVGNKRSREG